MLARKQVFIGLMILMLIGTQLIEDTPIHQHSHGLVDCALCHIPLADAVVINFVFEVVEHNYLYSLQVHFQNLYQSPNFLFFQGRAPPQV